MNVQALVTIGATLIGAAAAGLKARTENRRSKLIRADIKDDLDIWSKLPADATTKNPLMEYIDHRIAALVEAEALKTRDPASIWLGIVIFTSGLAGLVAALAGGGWWLLTSPFTGFLLILGAVGFSIGWELTYRDERGKKIEQRPRAGRTKTLSQKSSVLPSTE